MRINAKEFDKLTIGEQSLVEWQYRFCGGFTKALWYLMCRADNMNLDRLSRGFPSHVAAYRRYAGEIGWWQEVEAAVTRIDEVPSGNGDLTSCSEDPDDEGGA